MFTEKVMIVGIISIAFVLCCLIGSVCDVIKKKGSNDHERKNDDSV